VTAAVVATREIRDECDRGAVTDADGGSMPERANASVEDQ
jgi:hypothetical protein